MELLCIFAALAVLFLFCAFLTLKCNLHAALAPLSALGIAVAWLTAAGMANLLLPGTVLLWAVFAGSGVWALVPHKGQRPAYRRLVTPGAVLFWGMALAFAVYFFIRQPLATKYDELSLWATAVKVTKADNRLYALATLGTPWPQTQNPGLPLLAYFFQFAFVAILIVFQPEIRKALEQVGRNNVGQSIAAVVTGRDRSYDRAQIRKAINAVVDGVGILQQLKMGALIVFERKTKLGDIIETGTQINCEPSGQIVGNIFFNKAPLHDGAMIIRDGMIHAAGCILPLTKNTSVSAELGTRHRAALGVSEESDAVVVVVSEETGQISVAVNGVLARRFTRDTLRDVLEGYLIPQEEASTVRRKFGVLKSKRTVKK